MLSDWQFVKSKHQTDCSMQPASHGRMMGCINSTLNRLGLGRARQESKPSDIDLPENCESSKNLPHFLIKRDDLTSIKTNFSKLVVPERLDLTKLQLFKLISSWRVMRRDKNITKSGVEMFVW
ncbi:hypothetical protein RRG08_025747 [Elysia crispata]|uniref:Uncharacterized protein n=1 Tax=Elysia crispata TaxID=231223 RepID=A0AAE1DYA9_9GAST|nr:hypothetical protein RRG08_025747 [Elysia crispata]